MLLDGKNAVIYGAAGAIRATIAFAAEGAAVHLTGRNAATQDTVAKEITASGWTAHTAGRGRDRRGRGRKSCRHDRGAGREPGYLVQRVGCGRPVA
jgi:NAD(P)-dependent dehydrogenase (short-subunit alcohol dehydrogenase family)